MFLKNNNCVSIAKFSPQYCNEIIQKSDSLPIQEANIQDGNQDNRSSNVAWVKENQQLYKDLEKIVLEHNKSAGWNYDTLFNNRIFTFAFNYI